jgi:metal-responsive CopG/Arc/MetJ family transcriptional regulator
MNERLREVLIQRKYEKRMNHIDWETRSEWVSDWEKNEWIRESEEEEASESVKEWITYVLDSEEEEASESVIEWITNES